MPRIARVVEIGYPHHVTQRGNNKETVFYDDQDRMVYLELLKRHSLYYKLDVLAYCLMNNHVHLVVVPRSSESLSKTLSFAHMRYAQYFNRKMQRSGHLWQGRFYSSVMDQEYLLACVRYIERNPVRANIVTEALLYDWSSAKVHCGLGGNDNLNVKKLFDYVAGGDNEWREFLASHDDAIKVQRIKSLTQSGLPMGSRSFLGTLEKKFGKALRQRRKRKY